MNTMAQSESVSHSPTEVPKRPRGILKNSSSQQQISPEARISPSAVVAQSNESAIDGADSNRPAMPPREMSEKEITQMNTELNAGGHRRTSSNPRSSMGRRQSNQSNPDAEHDEQNMRLKWDEANLYLNEGQMGGRMKIDEPKTPFVKDYDPAEDEDEISLINTNELAVDELEMEKSKHTSRKTATREADIPSLELGEPEMDPKLSRESDGENKVMVESDSMDVDGQGYGHGEKSEEEMSSEEKEKHKKFEEMRKKHYEMRDVKNLLGHAPDELDIDGDEEDEEENDKR